LNLLVILAISLFIAPLIIQLEIFVVRKDIFAAKINSCETFFHYNTYFIA